MPFSYLFVFFFFNDTATTEIYTLSLHDALPISLRAFDVHAVDYLLKPFSRERFDRAFDQDRKSTRLNSSHSQISYAVFCLKKKKHTAITRLSYTRLIADPIYLSAAVVTSERQGS